MSTVTGKFAATSSLVNSNKEERVGDFSLTTKRGLITLSRINRAASSARTFEGLTNDVAEEEKEEAPGR